jgi:hypothetical protein
MEEREEVIGVASVNKERMQIPKLKVWIFCFIFVRAAAPLQRALPLTPTACPTPHFSQPIAIGLDFSLIGVSR